MSNRNLAEPQIVARAVTVIMAAVVGLTFLFGFGNVLTLAVRRTSCVVSGSWARLATFQWIEQTRGSRF